MKTTIIACLAMIALASNLRNNAANAQTFTSIKSFGILTNVTGFRPDFELVQGPDGTLYGTTSSGEGDVRGTIFKVRPDGSGFTVLKWFTNFVEGATPAGLTLSASTLYGTTQEGGSSDDGTVFKVNTDGTGYTVLKNFIRDSDGGRPVAGLMLSGSVLYGTTFSGGSSNRGTVFKVNADGTGYTVLYNFTGPGAYYEDIPHTGLTLSASTLYGTTFSGGSSNYGTVFKVNTDGTGYTVLYNFTGSDGARPYASLTLSGSVLYGTTFSGGSSGGGTVFKVNTDGTGYTVLYNFTGSDGAHPYASLTLSGSVLYGTTFSGGSSGGGTVFKVNTDGTGYTVLKNFIQGSDGERLCAGLTLFGSVLYGTTGGGGSWRGGTVFKVNTDGTGYTVLKNFITSSDGERPWAGLTLSGSALYGTTFFGGGWGAGTVFKVNIDSTGYTVLKNFNGSAGAFPSPGLTLSGSTLYGTTSLGGSSGGGTVFKVNTDGAGYTVLNNFNRMEYDRSTGGYTNSAGADPSPGLTLSGSTLYGTTLRGGSSGGGTVFKVNTDGTGYSVLKNFSWTGSSTNSDGADPFGGLTLSGSTLYGTTESGGSSGNGTVFKVNTDGSGYTVLKNFTGSDGADPSGGLTLSGSVLYGTTGGGGSSGGGTVFKVNSDGTGYSVLKNFSWTTYDPSTGSSTNSGGERPSAGLTLSGSVLYGTTGGGGSSGNGTVFKVNTDGSGYTVLKNFTGSDGADPSGGLTLSGSTLYGTTQSGGSSGVGSGTVFKLELSVPLTIKSLGNVVVLSWTGPALGLQAAPAVTSIYTNIPGALSPYTNTTAVPQLFFRLKMN